MFKDKNEILLHALSERYNSIHTIRERVHSTSIWLLGILLGLSGAILKLEIKITCIEKIAFLLIILMSWYIIYRFYYFDLEKGFSTQRNITAKIEDELGFYNGQDSIYPQSWKDCSKGHFFRNNYILIGFGFSVFILSVIYFL